MKALSLLIVIALAAVACQSEKYQSETESYGQSEATITTRADRADFASEMQRAWSDHIALTRMYIGSATAGAPDTDEIADRLMRNQVDIGNVVRPYYGDAAADQLTTLLKDHIAAAAEAVTAAKAKDDASLSQAKTKLYANGDEIATLLANANTEWNAADLKASMRTHLDLLLEQTTKHLSGDYKGDLEAYDKAHAHMIELSRTLSDGTMAKFADRFNP